MTLLKLIGGSLWHL